MAECGYCKDCKHWKPDILCEPDEDSDSIMFCALTEAEGDEMEGYLARPITFGQERSAVATAPDFGCVQFEPKP